MGLAARKDGVLAIAAMPRGRRKPSGIAAAAALENQSVSNINDFVPNSTRKRRPKGADLKTAPKSKPTKARLSSKLSTKRAALTTPPQSPRDTESKREQQSKQRAKRRENRQVRRDLAASSPRAQRQSSRTEGRARPRQLSPTRAVGTQTEVVTTQDALVQTEVIEADLTHKALRWLEQDFGAVEHQSTVPNQATSHSEISNMPEDASIFTQTSAHNGSTRSHRDAKANNLTRKGIMDQELEANGTPRVPKNIEEIRTAIGKPRTSSPGIPEYKRYMDLIFKPTNEEGTKDKLFKRFLGIPDDIGVDVKSGHLNEVNKAWTTLVPFTDVHTGVFYKPRPKPDYAEGIDQKIVDTRVTQLYPPIKVDTDMLLPNFVVELKHHASTFDAHAQNRFFGAVAARAWKAYDEKIYQPSPRPWLDMARVGSLEFNGDVMVGNIHWASKRRGTRTLKEPEYHMTRVMNHLVIGLSYEDFALAHREAHNFREYFFDERDKVVEEFQEKEREMNASRFEEEPPSRAESESQESRRSTSSIREVQVLIETSTGRTTSRESNNTVRGRISHATKAKQSGRKRAQESKVKTRGQAKRKKSNPPTEEQPESSNLTQETQGLNVDS